jgi:3-polyprenyl-4-hydroxybenzoate decarboxylase
MQNTIEIAKLSREEKLQVMEAIWTDLSLEEDKVTSPDWHNQALQETEHQFGTGKEKIIDWLGAKKELRKRSE